MLMKRLEDVTVKLDHVKLDHVTFKPSHVTSKPSQLNGGGEGEGDMSWNDEAARRLHAPSPPPTPRLQPTFASIIADISQLLGVGGGEEEACA